MSRFENATDAEIIARSEQDLNALARKSGTTLESTLADESGVDDEAYVTECVIKELVTTLAHGEAEQGTRIPDCRGDAAGHDGKDGPDWRWNERPGETREIEVEYHGKINLFILCCRLSRLRKAD